MNSLRVVGRQAWYELDRACNVLYSNLEQTGRMPQ